MASSAANVPTRAGITTRSTLRAPLRPAAAATITGGGGGYDDPDEDPDYDPLEDQPEENVEDEHAVFEALLDGEINKVPFALTPALASADIINYSTAEGAKLYKSATAALPVTFDGKDSEVLILLQALRVRAFASGWDSILNIPVGHRTYNLLTNYAQVSEERIKEHCWSYTG